MITTTISLYDKPNFIRSQKEIPFDIFLDGIGNGRWRQEVEVVRALPYKSEAQLNAKKQVTSVTISGKFKERKDDMLSQHSGYIGIDVDSVSDINKLKTLLAADRYIVAMFASISGQGLCLVFKINPEKHKEAFRGICEYLYNTYKIATDPTSINPSRSRFVSFDPDIRINKHAEKFAKYPKEKEPKKVDNVVFDDSDFSFILKQIQEGHVNLCENYYEWLRIGFAFAEKFGEGGRSYFHTVSSQSLKYDYRACDDQYNACLKANGHEKTSIKTFYYYVKQAGLEVYSDRTKEIIRVADSGKRAGLKKEDIVINLKKFADIDNADSIVDQVLSGNISAEGDTVIEQLEMMLKQTHNFRRNAITRYIEDNGVVLKQKDMNSVFIKCKKGLPLVSYELIERLINSNFVVDYNPFIEFFEKNKDVETGGRIKAAINCIHTKDQHYALHFATKWFVGLISSIFGAHSPLMLVLTGNTQNTGKTEWWRRLLPAELMPYYAESKLDAGKDDEILMTQKLIIMDDEMGGKSKKESKRLKELTSKQWFSLREPYGRNNVDLMRLAALGATSNENELLNDWSGNRRIIPIEVYNVDLDTYDKIDKTSLIMEAYNLYREGYKFRLDRDDIKWLGQDSVSYEVSNMESELVMKYFEPNAEAGAHWLTTTDIKVYLEDKTRQKLILDKIGKEMKRMGFTQKHIRAGAGTKRCFGVTYLIPGSTFESPGAQGYASQYDEPPF